MRLENQWDKSAPSRPLVLLAALVTTAALPLFLFADVVRSAYRSIVKKIPSDDHHYFFTSKIFTEYQKQLQEFIAAQVKEDPSLSDLPLVQSVQNPVKDKKQFYQGVVTALRQLVIQKQILEPNIARFVERLCFWTYTGAQLLPSMTTWIQEQKGPLIPPSILDLHRQWSIEPRFQGEVFQDYRPYDPRLLGDTPSHFFQVHNTQIIRTPAVTRDENRTLFGNLTQAAIVEEFQGYLDHCRRAGKKHLYVNLMAPHGSEKVRTEALEELEKKNPDTFQLITLSKDCPFYHQYGPFASQNDAELFKRTFLNEMLRENPAFHWPISWDLETIKNICSKAIDQVHAKYFTNAPTLDIEKRRSLIELAYTEIIEKLLQSKNPAVCNISCRSCVDRGAANLSLLYAKTEQTPSPQILEAIALAPALLSQNRTMLSHRMERLAPPLSILSSTT